MSEHLNHLKAAMGDRYEIVREIGSGGMATVFLARDRKHERDVALKVMRSEMAAVLGTDRFLHEIKTLATLTHPHILPLYDSGETDAGLFYVMPYVEGESLRDRLERETRLPVGEAVFIAREVADGLAYAHAHGVIHRDIKPENILLSGGHAIVADFGIARAVVEAGGEKLTATGLTVGTPAYMSPEQALAGSRVDGRSDLYSLACVLFEMLAGEIPFSGPDARTILSRKTGERPRALSSLRDTVPPSLEKAVGKALSAEPADRFATATEFAGALERAVTPAPFPIPAGAPMTDRVARPRRAWALWMGGIVVAALALGGLWTVLERGRDAMPRNQSTQSLAGDGIAVLPFHVVGADPELWREGLVYSLSTNIDDLAGLRKVDPRVVLSNWERRIGADADAPDIRSALDVAAAGGARYAVLGSLVELETTAHLSADVFDVRSGVRRGTAEAAGSPDSLEFLINQVTLGILEIAGGTSFRVDDLSRGRLTRSRLALRQYLLGERESRAFRWQEALEHYDAAVQADSSFALALYKASVACDWLHRDPEPYLSRALDLSDRLPERDALLLRGVAQRIEGLQTARFTLDTLVARYPGEVIGWYDLGEAIFHLGPMALLPPDEFRAAFEHTLDLDPGFVSAYVHLFGHALVREDSAGLAQLIRRHREVDSTSADLVAAEVAAALAWGDSAARSDALRRLDTAVVRALEGVGVYSIATPDLREDFAKVSRELAERGAPPVFEPVLVQAHAGRPDSAWAAASRPLPDSENRQLSAAMRLQLHVVGLPSEHDIWRTVDLLAPVADPAVRFLVGALAVQAGRWDVVQREMDRLAVDSTRSESEGTTNHSAGYARGLDAYALAWRGDREAGLEGIEVILPELPGWGSYFSGFPAHEALRHEVGWLLLSRGRLEEARRYFESLTYPIFGINVARAEACLGEVYERLGNPELAAYHYGRFARWWENGQPAYRAMAELGRSAVERVTGPVAEVPDEGLCVRLSAVRDSTLPGASSGSKVP